MAKLHLMWCVENPSADGRKAAWKPKLCKHLASKTSNSRDKINPERTGEQNCPAL